MNKEYYDLMVSYIERNIDKVRWNSDWNNFTIIDGSKEGYSTFYFSKIVKKHLIRKEEVTYKFSVFVNVGCDEDNSDAYKFLSELFSQE